MTPSGLRALVIASALGMLAARVAAQADPGGGDASAPEPEPSAGAERPLVLFLMPEVGEAAQAELREALLAQFALLDAALVFDRAPVAGSLGEQMADAQRRAAERSAIAVFWIEAQNDGRWFVHMMDSERERIVVRPADPAGDRRGAATEAVAVMTRESTRALLAGDPIPEQPPEPLPAPPSAAPPAPAPPAEPAPVSAPRARPLRLAASYLGTDFEEALAWRHGVAVAASWHGFLPAYAGASYVFTPLLQVQAEVESSQVDFDLQRMPAAVHFGYRQRWERAALDVEFGVVFEVQRRGALRIESEGVVERYEAETRLICALAPRVRGELAPMPELGLFAALGLDVLLNNFEYVVKYVDQPEAEPRTLLRADDVRPVLELGVAFYP
jgi:hypothetical protein